MPARDVPKFAGITSFLKSPVVEDLDSADADVAFAGVPWDSDCVYRAGTRFGPRSIRAASTLLRPHNRYLDLNVRETVDVVDYGDAPIIPGYTLDSFDITQAFVEDILAADAIPAIAGGNHGITLPILRAIADEHGPVSLVHFDAHSDLWTEYFGKEYNHGTWVHHALEEDLIDPETSIRVGERGAYYSDEDPDLYAESGIDYYTMDDVTDVGADAVGDRIEETVSGPTYVSLDIDAVDPAFAPGTGTPQPGGLTSNQILRLVRRLFEVDVVGFDLVEVSPDHDDSDATSILAAKLVFDLISAAVHPYE